jgi:hypothetical protein
MKTPNGATNGAMLDIDVILLPSRFSRPSMSPAEVFTSPNPRHFGQLLF